LAASFATCAALVPWLWTAWLERRFDRVATWRLMTVGLGFVGAAQLSASVTVIDRRHVGAWPAWIDLLGIAGATLGLVAAEAMIRRHRRRGTVDWTIPGSCVVAAAAGLLILTVIRVASSRDLSHSS